MKSKEQWYEWAKQYAKEDNDWLDDTDSELYSEMAYLLAEKCREFMDNMNEVQEQLLNGKDHGDIWVGIETFKELILQEEGEKSEDDESCTCTQART